MLIFDLARHVTIYIVLITKKWLSGAFDCLLARLAMATCRKLGRGRVGRISPPPHPLLATEMALMTAVRP